jgi:hypothetical protein
LEQAVRGSASFVLDTNAIAALLLAVIAVLAGRLSG